MVTGIKKELLEKEKEGIIVGRMRYEKERWRIVKSYMSEVMEEALKELEQWIEDREESVRTLMGGGGILMRGQEVVEREGDKGRSRRQSKDGKVNREERMLVEFIKKRGWSIFNGNINRNEKGSILLWEE